MNLFVLEGVSSLYVDTQEETGFIGGPATIKCYSQNSGEAKWCRLGGSCVQESQGSIDGTTVILDRNLSSVLRVTMRGLKMEDSGWYWCATGDLQMPVHLSVREESTTSKFYSFKIAEWCFSVGSHSSRSSIYFEQRDVWEASSALIPSLFYPESSWLSARPSWQIKRCYSYVVNI